MSRKLNFQTVPLAQLALKGATRQIDPPKPVVLVVDDEAVIAHPPIRGRAMEQGQPRRGR
jgi:hypothetical protein